MKYVSIDIETTGLDMDRCQVLEVGAVIDDLSWPEVVGKGPYGGRPYFRSLVDPGLIVGEPFALQMNQKLLMELHEARKEDKDISPAAVDLRLTTFMSMADDANLKAVCAGKNVASFDIPFLKKAGFECTCKRIHHRSVDPAMLYWQKGDRCSPSLSECLKRAGINEEVSHTACEDAWQVIRLIRHKLI